MAVFLRSVVLAFVLISFLSCTQTRLERVEPRIYQNLSKNTRNKILEEKVSQLRVAQGKIAKAITDIQNTQQEVTQAGERIKNQREVVKGKKKDIRGIDTNEMPDYQIGARKDDLDIAKHQVKTAKQRYWLKKQKLTTQKQELRVAEAQKDILLSEIELEKMRVIHTNSDKKVRDEAVQIARFEKQVKRFKLLKSQEDYRLAKKKVKIAQDIAKVQYLEGEDLTEEAPKNKFEINIPQPAITSR